MEEPKYYVRARQEPSCENEMHEWEDPTKNLLTCKKCGINGLSTAALKAVEEENKRRESNEN